LVLENFIKILQKNPLARSALFLTLRFVTTCVSRPITSRTKSIDISPNRAADDVLDENLSRCSLALGIRTVNERAQGGEDARPG
jgi:hypothetical protein